MTAWIGAACAAALALLSGALLIRERRINRELDQALSRTNQDLEHLERAFTRFAPQDVVEHMTGGAVDIPATHREVTVMFADLADFTRLSEQLEPGVMVPILNEYYRRMSRVIREHHGHVSRIMGDGLMALWGALQPNTWQCADATRAALAMCEALEVYNGELAARGHPQLRFGIGLHRGAVVTAVIGSDDLMEYTVIGDPVNTAARVEALTRTHGVPVLVTATIREGLDDRFTLTEQPPAPVKGKQEAVRTWSVEGFAG